MKSALLIINIQNYFINKWTQKLPQNIVRLINNGSFPAIVFTKFVNTPDSNFVRQFNYTKCTKPPYTDIVNDLQPWVKSDNIFVKNTYSAFLNGRLLDWLKKNKITDLTLVGIDTENCVLTNARAAFDYGLTVKVVADCCGSFTSGPQTHQAALEIIKNNIGKII